MKSDMDNMQWLDEYLLKIQFKTDNPFTVPEGFFDELHQRTLSRAVVDGVLGERETGLTVPDGYFDEMSAQLQSRIKIEAVAGDVAGLTVPENYFDQMQAHLQSRIGLEEVLHNSNGDLTVPDNYFEQMQAGLQSRINLEQVMQDATGDLLVPEDYFANMQANLQSRINIEDALSKSIGDLTVSTEYFEDQFQQISSRIEVEEILNSEGEGFSVPANYFSDLQNAIISKTAGQGQKSAVKRNAVIRKLFTSSTYKYATAACFLVAVGATWFLAQPESAQSRHEHSYIHKALAHIPDADLVKYLQLNIDQGSMPEATEAANNIDAKDAEALKQVLDIQ